VNGQLTMDNKHEYYYQIQGQIFVLNLEWVDFVVRTEIDAKILRIERNQQFIDKMQEGLKKLYFENYIWEVIKLYIRPAYLKQ
jgi:hypothetical protein